MGVMEVLSEGREVLEGKFEGRVDTTGAERGVLLNTILEVFFGVPSNTFDRFEEPLSMLGSMFSASLSSSNRAEEARRLVGVFKELLPESKAAVTAIFHS
jgi:hypothetical protein